MSKGDPGSLSLTQRKIQSVVNSGEYRKVENATVLVNKDGHAAIISSGGSFYWVDNVMLGFEYDLAAPK